MGTYEQKIFAKMEQEVLLAKQSDDRFERKLHLNTVKVLAELLLEETIEKTPKLSEEKIWQEMTGEKSTQEMPQNTGKIDFEDGANGKSLFDF
ncbi:hypothetical protein MFLO_12551 [Listeria floridensis FSL S10-1187]|uniref:Uncharacterized protein n=1 Tax=Listeria floridensis FSL S10-1187 TaxID=1265817 RepID=A0ABN0RD88_9LIST|nr:YwdI family protein [Listeria floridensis]EUJ28227.1 hypothetical protein MFLO_12551 [Listeria floridensis FSL S10-1187]